MNEKLGVTTAVSLFGLVVATIYLISYWGSFDIDIFQYAGLTDFVKLAIYPLGLALLGLVMGVAVTTISFPFEKLTRATASIKIESLPVALRIVAVIGLLVALAINVLAHGQWKWFATVMIFSPAASYVCFHEKIKERIPSLATRFHFVLLCVLIPLFAAMVGSSRAQNLKDGNAHVIVDNTGVAAGLKATPEHPLMFIGFVSDTFVIYETQTRSVVLIKQSDTLPFVLKPNTRSKDDIRSALRNIFS
ncbi:hypothetical protein [Paraburkholderia caffeinilytica]|uniref:hypothetical protein n=1 Tax=Paraburkholderia caffeinilytica TaxID=1761016 RepID=UPI0038BCD080